MSQFSEPFKILKHNSVVVNKLEGTITLTYTLSTSGGPITDASFTYSNQDQTPPTQGPFTVTFTGPDSGGNYSGTTSMSPPLNIQGEGEFKSGTMTFNPTANTLNGNFSSNAGGPPGDDDITWQAGTGEGEEASRKASTHY
jgi:hypothetical protein